MNRAQKEELSNKWVSQLEEMMYKEVGEIFRTGANTHTITWQVAEENDKPIYGSIKFTLHKEDYDLDSKIDEFEYFNEEKKIKEQQEKERQEKRKKEQEAKEARLAAKRAQEEKEKKKRQEYLNSLKDSQE